jgi:hypothetical protein
VRILHILLDGPTDLSERVIAAQAFVHDVQTMDLSLGDIAYEDLVDQIFAHDRVVSWHE